MVNNHNNSLIRIPSSRNKGFSGSTHFEVWLIPEAQKPAHSNKMATIWFKTAYRCTSIGLASSEDSDLNLVASPKKKKKEKKYLRPLQITMVEFFKKKKKKEEERPLVKCGIRISPDRSILRRFTCLFPGLRPHDRRIACFPMTVPFTFSNASSALFLPRNKMRE